MKKKIVSPLRVARLVRGQTQFDLARAIGVVPSRLSLLERGLIEPSRRERAALARALKSSPVELFGELAESSDG
jgi:transcriptional regulator with XRE-family HTH domain